MKKKVLFMVINMNIGGTEKALLNMIDAMPEDRYDITILMLEEYGGFLGFIPKRVKVIQLTGYESIKSLMNNPPKQILIRTLINKRITEFFQLSWIYFISAMKKDRSSLFKYLMKRISFHSDDYDAAIAYAGPMDFISYFILRKVSAKKKFQWIHFDITKIGFNQNFAFNNYREFNSIYAVSSEAKNKLVSILPDLSDKVKVFHNLVSPKKMQEAARIGQGFTDEFNGIRILSVGRLSPEKGQDLAIKATSKLISEGYNVRWYCIGDGNSKEELCRLVDELNVKQHYKLLGSCSNPYSYMAECDIFVQPSRYEGYCLTILEAKSFYKPIVTTNVNGVNEQIENGESGIIVDVNEGSLFYAVKKIIDDQTLRNTLMKNLEIEMKRTKVDSKKILEVI
jgi:glycosyltransferase involved in cell wall biosynthesis